MKRSVTGSFEAFEGLCRLAEKPFSNKEIILGDFPFPRHCEAASLPSAFLPSFLNTVSGACGVVWGQNPNGPLKAHKISHVGLIGNFPLII